MQGWPVTEPYWFPLNTSGDANLNERENRMATKFELGNGITCDADQLESAINEVQKYKKVKPEDRATISEKITEPKLKYVRVMKDGKSVIKLDAKKNKVQEPVLDDDDKPVTVTKNRVQVTDIADCDK